MTYYEREVVLERRVVPQPQPEIVRGGDCGACVLAGVLNLEVDTIYERFRKDRAPLAWTHMRQALWDARASNQVDRFIEHVPFWPTSLYNPMIEWGAPSWTMADAWHAYVTMGFDAGYYAIALVDIDQKGPIGGGTNHWVLLCGSRMRWDPFPDGKGASGRREILVSCSSRRTPDEEWVEDHKFLHDRGGYNLLLVRPRKFE